jgi:hypothetical protein
MAMANNMTPRLTYNQRKAYRQYLRLNDISSTPSTSSLLLSTWKDGDWKEVHRLVNEQISPVLLVYHKIPNNYELMATEWWPLQSNPHGYKDREDPKNLSSMQHRRSWSHAGTYGGSVLAINTGPLQIKRDHTWTIIPPVIQPAWARNTYGSALRIRHALAGLLKIDINTIDHFNEATLSREWHNSIFKSDGARMGNWMEHHLVEWLSLSNGMVLIKTVSGDSLRGYITLWSPHSSLMIDHAPMASSSSGQSETESSPKVEASESTRTKLLPSLGTIVWQSEEASSSAVVMLQCHNENDDTFFYKYDNDIGRIYSITTGCDYPIPLAPLSNSPSSSQEFLPNPFQTMLVTMTWDKSMIAIIGQAEGSDVIALYSPTELLRAAHQPFNDYKKSASSSSSISSSSSSHTQITGRGNSRKYMYHGRRDGNGDDQDSAVPDLVIRIRRGDDPIDDTWPEIPSSVLRMTRMFALGKHAWLAVWNDSRVRLCYYNNDDIDHDDINKGCPYVKIVKSIATHGMLSVDGIHVLDNDPEGRFVITLWTTWTPDEHTEWADKGVASGWEARSLQLWCGSRSCDPGSKWYRQPLWTWKLLINNLCDAHWLAHDRACTINLHCGEIVVYQIPSDISSSNPPVQLQKFQPRYSNTSFSSSTILNYPHHIIQSTTRCVANILSNDNIGMSPLLVALIVTYLLH